MVKLSLVKIFLLRFHLYVAKYVHDDRYIYYLCNDRYTILLYFCYFSQMHIFLLDLFLISSVAIFIAVYHSPIHYYKDCQICQESMCASTISPLDLFLYLSDQQRLATCPGLRLKAGFTGWGSVSLGAASPEQGPHTLRPHVQDGV